MALFTRIAQLVERLSYMQEVTGSKPFAGTSFGVVAQLVRVLACHARGRGFEPRSLRHIV
jgi:hypothetical protein